MNLKLLAKYPILPEASKILALYNITVDKFLDSEYLELSLSRIKAALDRNYTRERGASLSAEVISYYGAILIASCMRSRYVKDRLAEYEAGVMSQFLKEEESLDVHEMFYDMCGVKFDGCWLNMVKYVEIAPKRDEYRLVNRDLCGGFVKLTDDEKCELINGCLKSLISRRYPRKVPKAIVECLKESSSSLDEYDKFVREQSYGDVNILNFPPCIMSLYNDAVVGKNIPHVGRFALATFLYTIGVPVDAIVGVFGDSGETARYQVEHVTSSEYTTPSCDAMKSGGVCVCKCDVKNPLNYYKRC